MSNTSTKVFSLSVAALAVFAAWALVRDAPFSAGSHEATVVALPIAGPIAAPNAELSGLAWYGDDLLVLLPQYREVAGCPSSAGCLYVLARSKIERLLDGSSEGPLIPAVMPIEAAGMPDIEGFEGYEAIAFHNHEAYLLVESETADRTAAHLLRGHMDLGRGRLILDTEYVPTLVPQGIEPNLSYESLLVNERGVVALPEVRGDASGVSALLFSLDLRSMVRMPLTALDFRLTDVTGLGPGGSFWGLNVYWPGPTAEYSSVDGAPPDHAVERILKFHWTSDGIECEPSPALVLRSVPGVTRTRNWEGLVRLGDRGFLIVTDEYPGSLFAFAPYPFDSE